MKINQSWHDANKLPRHPSVAERVNWYAQHLRYCGCSLGPNAMSQELKRQAGILDDSEQN